MDNPPDAASSILSPYPLMSASNYLTVRPVETEFDSNAQAIVHGSVSAVSGEKLNDLRGNLRNGFDLKCEVLLSMMSCRKCV